MEFHIRRPLIFTALTLIATGLIAGCSKESPKKVPYIRPKANEKIQNAGQTINFNPKVDILLIVDNSGSMGDKQDNLSRNIGLFTNGLERMKLLDYHIGVITSDIGHKGKLAGKTNFIDRNTVDGMQILKENLLVGTNGHYSEMMFDPVFLALSSPIVDVENFGFYRPDAYLVLIFITDTDDQSMRLSAGSFHQFLLGLKKNDKKKLIAYGVHIPTKDTTCDRSGEELPFRLEEFFRLTGAKTLGLCDPNYGEKLAALGDDMVGKIGRKLYLSRPPIVHTIKVTFGTQVIPNDSEKGWTFDASQNAVVFGRDIEWDNTQSQARVEVDFLAADYD